MRRKCLLDYILLWKYFIACLIRFLWVRVILCLLRLRKTHNALQLPVFLFSFSCQPYPKYRGIRSKNYFKNHQTTYTVQLFAPIKRAIFRVYSFSEQVAAKGNSLETT